MRINKILLSRFDFIQSRIAIAVSSTTGKHKNIMAGRNRIPSITYYYCSTSTEDNTSFLTFISDFDCCRRLSCNRITITGDTTVISYQERLSHVSNRFSLTKVFLAHCIFLPYQYLSHSILNSREEEEEEKQQR